MTGSGIASPTNHAVTLAEWRKACGADDAGGYHGQATKEVGGNGVQDASDVKRRILAGMERRGAVEAWWPTCHCDADPDFPIVLDCFSGIGTTALAAHSLKRRAWLIELAPEYCALTKKRLEKALVAMPRKLPPGQGVMAELIDNPFADTQQPTGQAELPLD